MIALFSLLIGLPIMAAESPFDYDWSTNNPGCHVKFGWDFGSPYNKFGFPTPSPDGTEMWGAVYPEGFEKGPSWKDLETGDATNRFKIADVYGSTTNCWASFPSGTYYLAVYAYNVHLASTNYSTNYDNTGTPTIVTNVNPAFRVRSEPSNIIELKVPKIRANLHLLSSEGVTTNLVVENSYEVDVTGSQEKLFTLRLDFTKPVIVPIPEPPPLP